MANREGDPSAEIDDLLEDVLPSEVESLSDDGSGTTTTSWLKERFTLRNEYADDYLVDLANDEIDDYTDEIGVGTGTATMAKSLFHQYFQQTESDKLLVVEIYAAAAVYCTCKINETGVGPTTIAKAGPDFLTRKLLLRRSKRVANTLGLNPEPFFDPGQVVDNLCDTLEVARPVKETTLEILDAGETANVNSGKSPSALAASALYAASRYFDNSLTQSDIADAANVSTVSIRNHYPNLIEAAEQHQNLNHFNPDDAVIKLCETLDLDESVKSNSLQALDEIDPPTTGRRFHADKLAAAIVYRVASEKGIDITHREVATAGNIDKGEIDGTQSMVTGPVREAVTTTEE